MTPPPADGSSYRFLSDVIMARGLVEPAAMKASLQASLAGRSLTEILVDNGHLGEDDLARTLAEHHRLDHVDLEVFAVDADAASLIEPDVARRFGAVPIASLPSGSLVVALHDPNGSTAALEFARLTGRPIQPAVASRTQVEALVESLRHAPDSFDDAALPADATHLQSVPDAAAVLPSPAPVASDHARVSLAAPSPAAPRSWSSGDAEREIEAARRRAELAEERCHAAEERARAAEELTRLAEARARAAEERAQAAGARVDAAARADSVSSAADAATDMLMRMLHACEMLEHEALSSGAAAEVLRAVVEAERSQRMQLEAQLRYPPGHLVELEERVAEIERLLTGVAPAPGPALEPGPAEEQALALAAPVTAPPPADALVAGPLAAEPGPQPFAAGPLAAEAEPESLAAYPLAESPAAQSRPESLVAETAAEDLRTAPEPVQAEAWPGTAPDAIGPPVAAALPMVSSDAPPPFAASNPVQPRRRRGLFGARRRGT